MAQGRAIYGAKEAPCMGKVVLAWNRARAASARPWLGGWDQMTGVARLTARRKAGGPPGPGQSQAPVRSRACSSQASGATGPLGSSGRLGEREFGLPAFNGLPFPSLPFPHLGRLQE